MDNMLKYQENNNKFDENMEKKMKELEERKQNYFQTQEDIKKQQFQQQNNQSKKLNTGRSNSASLYKKDLINNNQNQQQQKNQYKSYISSKQKMNSSAGYKSYNQENEINKDFSKNKPEDFKIKQSRISVKKNGVIKAYAANTHQGIYRNYNEDRVTIILSIPKPAHKSNISYWPSCSFFGVFDGHGGYRCADFLRDKLHKYVLNNENFPHQPIQAIKEGYQQAETDFLELSDNINDRSGSCAIVIIIIDGFAYIVNVGDSRAILSQNCGKIVTDLSNDHKPQLEKERIEKAGAKIYKSRENNSNYYSFAGTDYEIPYRILPGKLSVSRTFGDIMAKQKKFGGNPLGVIAEPEIQIIKITDDMDFILIASDGIFDQMSSEQVSKSIWNSTKVNKQQNIHFQSGECVRNLLKDVFVQKSLDNVTAVLISFKNFKKTLFSEQKSEQNSVLESSQNQNLQIEIQKQQQQQKQLQQQQQIMQLQQNLQSNTEELQKKDKYGHKYSNSYSNIISNNNNNQKSKNIDNFNKFSFIGENQQNNNDNNHNKSNKTYSILERYLSQNNGENYQNSSNNSNKNSNIKQNYFNNDYNSIISNNIIINESQQESQKQISIDQLEQNCLKISQKVNEQLGNFGNSSQFEEKNQNNTQKKNENRENNINSSINQQFLQNQNLKIRNNNYSIESFNQQNNYKSQLQNNNDNIFMRSYNKENIQNIENNDKLFKTFTSKKQVQFADENNNSYSSEQIQNNLNKQKPNTGYLKSSNKINYAQYVKIAL